MLGNIAIVICLLINHNIKCTILYRAPKIQDALRIFVFVSETCFYIWHSLVTKPRFSTCKETDKRVIRGTLETAEVIRFHVIAYSTLPVTDELVTSLNLVILSSKLVGNGKVGSDHHGRPKVFWRGLQLYPVNSTNWRSAHLNWYDI